VASVVFSLLHSLRFTIRSRVSLHLEIIALRHQLAVVNRSRRPCLRLTPVDRMLWAWLSRSWRGWREAIHIVKPDTVIAWHRQGFRLFWTWKSRHHFGRPAVSPDVRALIREMSTANPLWGAPRIHGELLKLGISVSESTVAKYMRPHPRPPSQSWRTFLTDHASQLMAADPFVVPSVTFRLLFVLVILAHDRRQIVHVAVTEHPTAAWTAQQLRNAFPENEAPRYLLHDRDSVFAHVATTLEGMNIQEVRTAPRSPWQNAYAERHRLDPTRVRRSRHRGQRRGAASRPHRVGQLLHAGTNAPGTGEGRAHLAPGHAVLGRANRRDAARRRAPPSLRSRGSLELSVDTSHGIPGSLALYIDAHMRLYRFFAVKSALSWVILADRGGDSGPTSRLTRALSRSDRLRDSHTHLVRSEVIARRLFARLEAIS